MYLRPILYDHYIMKILYHHRVASKDGQYVHIDSLLKSFRDLGNEIIIVQPNISTVSFGGVSGFFSSLKSKLPRFLYEILELSYSFVDLVKLLYVIKKYKPDVIYERYNLFFPSGVWAKKISGIPLLLEVNAPLFEERSKHSGISLSRLARWTEQYVWKNSDHLYPVTQVLGNYVVSSVGCENKMTVLQNGIDPQLFHHKKKAEDLITQYRLSGKVVLGFVGFIRDWHGLERVFDAMVSVPPDSWHFLVIGDGPARTNLEEKARLNGLSDNLSITGVVDRDNISDYLSVIDIALQPDVVEYASPLKLFEYMAMGKAIVAVDKPNIQEILTHGVDALLFDNNDSKGLTANILSLYDSHLLREEMGNAAMATIMRKKLLWFENGRIITNDMHRLSGAPET